MEANTDFSETCQHDLSLSLYEINEDHVNCFLCARCYLSERRR